jgi:hypothetical protein
MSSAAVTHNFTNGLVGDADQVDQNFSDLVSFCNTHLAHRGEHVPDVMLRDEFTANSPTFDDTPDVTLYTASAAVTLVSGHMYEVRFFWPKMASTVSGDLAILELMTGATVRLEWNVEGSSTARHGGTAFRFLSCTSQIGSGAQTFSVQGHRAAGTGVMNIAADTNARASLVVIDWGLE